MGSRWLWMDVLTNYLTDAKQQQKKDEKLKIANKMESATCNRCMDIFLGEAGTNPCLELQSAKFNNGCETALVCARGGTVRHIPVEEYLTIHSTANSKAKKKGRH